ncbi:Uncharacterized membrane protein, predicted efflux pump [Phaffia rhodozyma]|uniref:Uncharacterized membrane protein, predicted efflux pump n=1 Tax=Phaffia rhodozyma TaxID=264483 RepID=A0A0F7SND8_PHARH|nr:Uncharacterized membrane protein, predicted efflux pump [Phaffia rhodozyma]
MSSSFPHYSALASSLQSTSPVNNDLRTLIERSHVRSASRSSRRPSSHSFVSYREREALLRQQQDNASLIGDSAIADDDAQHDRSPTSATFGNYGSTSIRRGSNASALSNGTKLHRGNRFGRLSMINHNVPAGLVHLQGPYPHQAVESKVPIMDPQVLTAEQGGETAEEEEERILGGPAGGDLDVDGEIVLSDKLNWRAAMKAEAVVVTYTTIPILFTQAAEFSLIIASVVSIGHLSSGPIDLAASSSVSSPALSDSKSIIDHGIASSLDTLLPAAWTSSDPTRVGLWAQRVAVISVGAMFPMYLVWFNAEQVLLFLKQEPEVAKKAGLYLRALSVGIPGYGGVCIMKKVFQAQGLMHIPTIVIFFVAPFNLLLNYFLVWGPLSAIRIGFAGAPLATGLSYTLEAICFIGYAFWSKDKRAWPEFELRQAFGKLGTVTTLALAGIGQICSEWWSWEIVTLAASLLGPAALATQSILLIACSITYQIPFSMSIAIAVRAGNLLGAQRGFEAMWACRTALLLSIIVSTFNSILLLVFRNSFAKLFNSDPVVVKTVADIIPFLAFFQLADGLMGVSNGILRVMGKQATLINLSSYYIFGIPVGVYLCFARHMDLTGLWIGLSIALTYSAVLCNIIIYRADWDVEVEKANARIGLANGEIEAGGLLDDVDEEEEGDGTP